MSNYNPKTNQLPKMQGTRWQDNNGQSVETKTVRIPVYLADEIVNFALQRHQEEVAKQAQVDKMA